MMAINPSILLLMSVCPVFPNNRINGVILMIFLSSSFLRIAVFERFYIINDEDNIFHLNPQIRAISSSSSGHNGFSSVDKLPVSIAFRIISIEGTA